MKRTIDYTPMSANRHMSYSDLVWHEYERYNVLGSGATTRALRLNADYVIVHTEDKYKLYLQLGLGLVIPYTIRVASPSADVRMRYRFVARRYRVYNQLSDGEQSGIVRNTKRDDERAIVNIERQWINLYDDEIDAQYNQGYSYDERAKRIRDIKAQRTRDTLTDLVNSGIRSIIPAARVYLETNVQKRIYDLRCDLHGGNFGILPDGRMVWTDPFI